MDFSGLTPEQQEKVLNAKTPEEILSLAKEEGYELSDKELDGIAGGATYWGNVCVGRECHDYKGCKVY